MNLIKYTILYTKHMICIISQIYIVQTKHPTTMKIYIYNYICNYARGNFKTHVGVIYGLAENSSY